MQYDFSRELARYGPAATYRPVDLAAARSYCQRLTRGHYENFSVASLLLPRRLVRPFQAVYAYCRWADDLADETGGGDRALQLLHWWRDELWSCYAGQARHPVMVALLPVVRRYRIPAEPFLALLGAFEQDQQVKQYQTYEQLLNYCECSANPVGQLVLYLCDACNAENARLSDCICTGLQLANFWQDVARDWTLGRVYLPAEDRERFGYTEDDLQARRFTPAFAELLRCEVARARELFHAGLPLVRRLPPEIRTDIELFARGGLAILRKIEEAGYNVWQSRPALSKWDKAALLLQVLARSWTAPIDE